MSDYSSIRETEEIKDERDTNWQQVKALMTLCNELQYKNTMLEEELRETFTSKINTQHEHHESQMKVAENEIRRLNTIIDFLYMRGRE